MNVAPRSRDWPLSAGCPVCAKFVVERSVAAGLGLSQRTIDVDLGRVVLGVCNSVDPHGSTDGVRSQGCASLNLVKRARLFDRDQVPWADVILKGLLQADSVAGQAV